MWEHAAEWSEAPQKRSIHKRAVFTASSKQVIPAMYRITNSLEWNCYVNTSNVILFDIQVHLFAIMHYIPATSISIQNNLRDFRFFDSLKNKCWIKLKEQIFCFQNFDFIQLISFRSVYLDNVNRGHRLVLVLNKVYSFCTNW